MYKNKKQNLENLFRTLGENNQLNGAILVAEKGEILYENSFGLADFITKRPLHNKSVFELASLSKPFTALGIILLEQQGKLSYDDLIERWLPALPYMGITIRHLLNHTSGLPDYMDLFQHYWETDKIAVNKDVVNMLIKHQPPSYFPPNEGWLYSNTGYVLLAVIIEKISGLRFEDFMREALFHPLGMAGTRVYNRRLQNKEVIPNYAYGYVYDVHSGQYVLPDELAETNYVVFLDGIQGDGTVNSNIRDLYLFDQALYTEEIISQASKEQAFFPVQWNKEEKLGYGFGWLIQDSPDKGRIVSHDGSWPGYSTSMIRYTDHNRTLIYLSNMEQDYEYEQAILAAAENILFDQPYVIPERPADKKKADIDPAIYSCYIGTYSFNDGTNALVTTEQDRLYLQITGQAQFELFPFSETRYFIQSLPVEVEFILDKEQKANRFVVYQNGGEEEAIRMK
ncbi:serine hydrolase [Bacillus atrophaeus]|uniref:serine hydrolase n=1 Tax=Bacillus atrophaeus TaxID=1452 RepID=UPI001238CF22|nr:serine hydrolase [Bacillus atrophaeus]KAA6449174.1 serine hydrolase [Bacillus atrophaeus]